VVVIASPGRLPAYDLLAALPFDLQHAPGMPSRGRRLLIVLLYLLGASIAVGIVAVVLISPQCSSDEMCTREEEIVQAICGWVWLAAALAIVVLGVRGKLWGARRKVL
jgi:hypothetical protein